MSDINLEYYKVFYHVVKSGSITAAARELSISQPAVSQQISALEKKLGLSLFSRNGRGIRLTAEGESLYEYVSRGIDEILQGEKRLWQMQQLEAGQVRIGASDMTLRFFLLPYLEIFHNLYPGIKVTVTNGPTPETLKALSEDKIDFGVVSSPFPDNIRAVPYAQNPSRKELLMGEKGTETVLRYTDVKEIRDTFVAGRSFIQYKNHMLDIAELEKMPLISLEGDTASGNYVRKFLEENHVTLKPEFSLATSDMIVEFAERSLGVGIVVRDFARDSLESGRLFELLFKQRITPRQIRLVTDPRHPLSTAASGLLDIILKNSKVSH
ncbi:LysR family transcriptional regulator [Butyrivibrio sp. MC2013]|uniref:LysR family transcriptional regulator n=1 Tax=Butyrivibrio sp. MC2013 TaxID=1280686 RepID=UPI0003FA645F|nr:LysR family transcriptional regulator [Butyrivibrio sp. MC2013]